MTSQRVKSPDVLRAIIAQEELSLGMLAELVKCSKGFISHLVSGRKTGCTDELASRISEALQTPKAVLFVPELASNKCQSGRNSVLV